jgi:hypothetical protein
MKLEILKGCIFILIGAYLCKRFLPDSSPNQPVVSQSQSQDCKIVIKKEIKPDGTVSRTTELFSSQASNQVVKPLNVKKHSLSYIPKYNFNNGATYHSAIYTYNNLGVYIASNRELGLVFKYDF